MRGVCICTITCIMLLFCVLLYYPSIIMIMVKNVNVITVKDDCFSPAQSERFLTLWTCYNLGAMATKVRRHDTRVHPYQRIVTADRGQFSLLATLCY